MSTSRTSWTIPVSDNQTRLKVARGAERTVVGNTITRLVPRKLVRVYRALRPVPPAPRAVLARYATRREDVCFVQIGSHNGCDGDPLFPHIENNAGWRGVMVEPVPEHFAVLQARRGSDPRFRLVQAAITSHGGRVEMMTVDAVDGMPDWADQLSSLDPAVVLSHERAIADLRSHTRMVSVPAMTFAELVVGLDRIDLLHVDTEGHDAAILDQVDFDAWRPDVILFEHKHLSSVDRKRCRVRLEAAGYQLSADDADTIAVRSDVYGEVLNHG